MKIGIVTFHRAHNCGAALQCLALVVVLRRMGHAVSVIDSNDVGDGLKIRFDGCSSLRGFLSYAKRTACAWLNVHRRRYRRFMKRNLPLTEKLAGDAVPQGFDCVVLGSDQVLNPSIVSGHEGVFLLENIPNTVRRVAYAASFGVKSLPENCRGRYSSALGRFASLSVRESSALEICRKELSLDNDIAVALDPTLLLDAGDYLPFERKVDVGGDYVLVYTVGGAAMSVVNGLAERIAARYGVKVVFATLIFSNPEPHWLPVSPDELLYLARNARFVVTTSFHGTAFSIINRKPFLTVVPESQPVSGRITDLLGKLGLMDRIVGESAANGVLTPDVFAEIDYGAVSSRLRALRDESLAFLNGALHE